MLPFGEAWTRSVIHKRSDTLVCAQVGYPRTIRVDNGSEFISRDLDLWAYANDVTLDFSRPGKPTDTDEIEQPFSFLLCHFPGCGRPRGQERSVGWKLRRAA